MGIPLGWTNRLADKLRAAPQPEKPHHVSLRLCDTHGPVVPIVWFRTELLTQIPGAMFVNTRSIPYAACPICQEAVRGYFAVDPASLQ